MLVVFYCNSQTCKRIHIRTDERKKNEHAFCPVCEKRMRFVCDFNSWTEYDENMRKRMIDSVLALESDNVSVLSAIAGINQNIMKEELSELDRLHIKHQELLAENKRLKRMAEECKEDYSIWKERVVLYHDSLWNLLLHYEPEKYSRDCPK